MIAKGDPLRGVIIVAKKSTKKIVPPNVTKVTLKMS